MSSLNPIDYMQSALESDPPKRLSVISIKNIYEIKFEPAISIGSFDK